MVCAECMKMCCLGGKNSVVKGLNIEFVQRFANSAETKTATEHVHTLFLKYCTCSVMVFVLLNLQDLSKLLYLVLAGSRDGTLAKHLLCSLGSECSPPQ